MVAMTVNQMVCVAQANIEEHQKCSRLRSYFMATVWAAASYSRGGFSLCRAGCARCVMVTGESTFRLQPGTIHPCWNHWYRMS